MIMNKWDVLSFSILPFINYIFRWNFLIETRILLEERILLDKISSLNDS